jgi:hypothetical protein
VTTGAREHLAWLMWCYQEGYMLPEDRAPMTNWLLEPDVMLHPEDVAERDALLTMADEVLAALEGERS